MADIKKGIKRIIWILSVVFSIAAWIIVFLNTDLSPRLKTDQAEVVFIRWLDKHYFEDKHDFTADEYRLQKSFGEELEEIKAKIEKSAKPDSVDRWPFMYELGTNLEFKDWLLRRNWRNRLGDALELNIDEIKKTFPKMDTKELLERYSNHDAKFNVQKYVFPKRYFHRPLGSIFLIVLLGFIPFTIIWFLWFLTQWVISGFKN